MKKISTRRRLWLEKRSRRFLRTLNKWRKLNNTNRKHRPKNLGSIYWAPERLSVYGPWGKELISLINELQEKTLRKKKISVLNCSTTDSILPHGAILLHAELDRLISSSSLPNPIRMIPPKSKRCRQVFKQIGLLDLCKNSDHKISPDREDVIYWRCTAGSDQSGDGPGNLIERVAEKANEYAKNRLIIENIWPGVSEAIINTTEHAYSRKICDFPPPHPDKKWWLLTSVRKGSFAAAVCDLGIGYRRTTPQTVPERFTEKITELLRIKNLDSRAIQLAMEYGRSRTGEKGRGKGSRDAISVVSTHQEGELVIISNTGVVRYEYNKESPDPVIETRALEVDINATIIWWRLPLTEVQYEKDISG